MKVLSVRVESSYATIDTVVQFLFLIDSKFRITLNTKLTPRERIMSDAMTAMTKQTHRSVKDSVKDRFREMPASRAAAAGR